MDSFVRRLSRNETDDESSGTASHYDSASGERSSKRRKRDEIRDSQSDDGSDESAGETQSDSKGSNKTYGDHSDGRSRPEHLTEFENALPPTQTDESAIEEYEQMKSSQTAAEIDDTTQKTKPLWIRGRSSIYVDAFNLALDTVLEEEAQLFNAKELEVFQMWKELDYESQYL